MFDTIFKLVARASISLIVKVLPQSVPTFVNLLPMHGQFASPTIGCRRLSFRAKNWSFAPCPFLVSHLQPSCVTRQIHKSLSSSLESSGSRCHCSEWFQEFYSNRKGESTPSWISRTYMSSFGSRNYAWICHSLPSPARLPGFGEHPWRICMCPSFQSINLSYTLMPIPVCGLALWALICCNIGLGLD